MNSVNNLLVCGFRNEKQILSKKEGLNEIKVGSTVYETMLKCIERVLYPSKQYSQRLPQNQSVTKRNKVTRHVCEA
jgi:hypothetical protein